MGAQRRDGTHETDSHQLLAGRGEYEARGDVQHHIGGWGRHFFCFFAVSCCAEGHSAARTRPRGRWVLEAAGHAALLCAVEVWCANDAAPVAIPKLFVVALLCLRTGTVVDRAHTIESFFVCAWDARVRVYLRCRAGKCTELVQKCSGQAAESPAQGFKRSPQSRNAT